MIGCIFADKGPLECGIESSFSGSGWGANGAFRWIFDPNPCIFEEGRGPSNVGDHQMHIRGEMTSGKLTLSAL